MQLGALAAHLRIKHAEHIDAPDSSLGAPINAAKVRILKDKLILVYDRLAKGITTLPAFQQLNQELDGDSHLNEFNSLIQHMVNYVETKSLKEIFNYTTKLLDKLNMLANSLSHLPREKTLLLDEAIKRIQDYIWQANKSILNIHDLKGIDLDFPQLVGILEKPPVPTWQFGPGKSIVQPKIRQKFHHAKDLMKRLEEENQQEDAKRK